MKLVLRDLDVLRCAHEAPCANERACQEGVRRSFEKMLEETTDLCSQLLQALHEVVL